MGRNILCQSRGDRSVTRRQRYIHGSDVRGRGGLSVNRR